MVNACKTTTIGDITFSPSSITVTDGSTATAEFTVPVDGVDTANGLTNLCGTKVYAIKQNSDNAAVSTWAAITDSAVTTGSKTLTIDPSVYGSHISSSISETLTVTTTFEDWVSNGGSTSTIAVTINTIACDCSSLAWTAPTVTSTTINVDASGTPSIPDPVSDTSAQSSVPAFSACYELNTDCATTGSYASNSITYDDNTGAGAALPAWITFDGTTLTVAPTLPSVAGTHTLLGTFTPTYGTATIFPVVTIVVDCAVTAFTRPANPSSGLSYNLFDAPLYFDFSQDWVQTPACGLTFTDSFTWTGLNTYVT